VHSGCTMLQFKKFATPVSMRRMISTGSWTGITIGIDERLDDFQEEGIEGEERSDDKGGDAMEDD
jgi:hypothetical protein